MRLKDGLLKMAEAARDASMNSLNISTEIKNRALSMIARSLSSSKATIIKANKKDIALAKKRGLSRAFIDRLTLDAKRIDQMCVSLTEIISLPDPVGEVIKALRRPNGLWIHKVRVPIGVIAIIYESRPNVTSDCVGLCLKSGNSVILRGGSESLNTNLAIYKLIKNAVIESGIDGSMVNMIETSDRKAVDELLKMKDHVDLVMPRGGEELINKVVSLSKIPVIKHYKGICHVFVDEWADLNMATNICFNAKVQRPGVCNAMESMLVHKDVAIRFLPGMLKKFKEAGVQIRGCQMTKRIAKGVNVLTATEKDYRTEYLDLILSVKVVDSLHDAITHVNKYGSHHSDAIVTESYDNAIRFLRNVDSACVYANASTRFTDGYQFGMGAEIGISTDKLHARGPMALEELTTYKYMVFGSGQLRT